MMLRMFSVLVGVLCVAFAACTSKVDTASRQRPELRLVRTAFNELERASEKLPDVEFRIVAEGGSSIASLLELKNGRADISQPNADVAYLAYAGQLDEMPGTFDQLRGMAVTDFNTLHLLAARHTNIKTLADLEGRRVSLGPPASSIALIARQLLAAHHIGARGEQIPNAEMIKRLTKGAIDAAFVTFGLPNQGVATALREGARLIEVEGPVVEEIRTRYPYLKRTLIPRGTYPNQPEPIHTLGVDVLLVCRADVDEDVIYRVLEAYYATSPFPSAPNLERAPATPIPLHAGAARYYRQRELLR
jgi:TRAP transporter TAXI family solute receptor